MRGFSCPTACGIFLDQESKPCLLYWQEDSSSLGHHWSPVLLILKSFRWIDHDFSLLRQTTLTLWCSANLQNGGNKIYLPWVAVRVSPALSLPTFWEVILPLSAQKKILRYPIPENEIPSSLQNSALGEGRTLQEEISVSKVSKSRILRNLCYSEICFENENDCKKWPSVGTSLVAQWWRIHSPMQRTWVQSLVWEDSTGCGAAKPMSHNYWSPCTL